MIGEAIKEKWSKRAGYRELLKLAFPLILSTGSVSVLLFVDRMFLGWHSKESLAASVPAGVLNFALMAPFFGTAVFAGTMVAQYSGAGKPGRLGSVLGQGLYVALIGGVLLPLLGPFADEIFAFIGHEASVQDQEARYFKILNMGVFFGLANAVMGGFYSGRGKTWTVMRMNVLLALLNIGLDYILIFGAWGSPSYGIEGAAVGTVVSHFTVFAIYLFLVTRRYHHERFNTRFLWRFDRPLFERLLKFGAPSGIHFFLDVMGFTAFVLLLGRMGNLELTASNIVLQVKMMGFLPMVGMGIATSILVGQFQGARESDRARQVFFSALQLACVYNAIMISLYVFAPRILMSPFMIGDAFPDMEALAKLSSQLMRFIAVGTFFNTLSAIASAALKGAGDTPYVMRVLVVSSICLLVGPVYVIVEVLHAPIHYAWAVLTLNSICVSSIFFLRFKRGKWKSIEVVER